VSRQIAGWEYVHIAIDDCTRLAYAEVLRDHKTRTVVALLRRVVQFFDRHGVAVERVLTDNGASYCTAVHAIACRALGIRHLRTRPYRARTNGKAGRFIRTLIAGWAYGAVHRASAGRAAVLEGWLWYYNHQRRRSALGHKPPIARLNERTNLPGTYTYAGGARSCGVPTAPAALATAQRSIPKPSEETRPIGHWDPPAAVSRGSVPSPAPAREA
jgi:transposase InsO family protein